MKKIQVSAGRTNFLYKMKIPGVQKMPDHSPARARENVEKLKKCGKGEHFEGPKVKHHRKTEEKPAGEGVKMWKLGRYLLRNTI